MITQGVERAKNYDKNFHFESEFNTQNSGAE